MFNIVNRDFMLADDLLTWQEAEELRPENTAAITSSLSRPVLNPAKVRSRHRAQIRCGRIATQTHSLRL